MSRAKPHFVRVSDGPGKPSRVYPCDSKRAALDCAREAFRTGFEGLTVAIIEGNPRDNADRDPVKVWP